MVKTMIKQDMLIINEGNDTQLEERAPTHVYYELADGRLVPIEVGGLVELAITELSGQLMDAVEERVTPPLIGLN